MNTTEVTFVPFDLKSALFLRLAHKTITWYLHLQLSAQIKEYTLIRFLIYN